VAELQDVVPAKAGTPFRKLRELSKKILNGVPAFAGTTIA
jgi:hypothetical protein